MCSISKCKIYLIRITCLASRVYDLQCACVCMGVYKQHTQTHTKAYLGLHATCMLHVCGIELVTDLYCIQYITMFGEY